MNSELVTIVADEIDIFLRDKGLFVGRDDLEDLADIVIGAVNLYAVEEEDPLEDDYDLDDEIEMVLAM